MLFDAAYRFDCTVFTSVLVTNRLCTPHGIDNFFRWSSPREILAGARPGFRGCVAGALRTRPSSSASPQPRYGPGSTDRGPTAPRPRRSRPGFARNATSRASSSSTADAHTISVLLSFPRRRHASSLEGEDVAESVLLLSPTRTRRFLRRVRVFSSRSLPRLRCLFFLAPPF